MKNLSISWRINDYRIFLLLTVSLGLTYNLLFDVSWQYFGINACAQAFVNACLITIAGFTYQNRNNLEKAKLFFEMAMPSIMFALSLLCTNKAILYYDYIWASLAAVMMLAGVSEIRTALRGKK